MLFDICIFSVLFFVVVIFGFVYLQPNAVGYLYFFSIVSRKKLMNEKDIFFFVCNFRFCVFTVGCFLYLYFISIVPSNKS